MRSRKKEMGAIVSEFMGSALVSELEVGGAARVPEYHIETRPGVNPVRVGSRRFSPKEIDELKKLLSKLVEAGVARPSKSKWAAPVVLVKKKKDGTMRLTIDYRKLNEVIEQDAFPIPRIDETLEKVGRSKVFHVVGSSQWVLTNACG